VLLTSLVSEGVLAFLRCRNIDIYGVHKHVKFLLAPLSPFKLRTDLGETQRRKGTTRKRDQEVDQMYVVWCNSPV
jgi:hypothetical protein